MDLRTLLIIQTVVGVIGLVPAYCIGIGSVISAADAQNHTKLAGVIIPVALSLPFVLGLCLIAMWVARYCGAPRLAVGLVVLPWAHLGLLVSLMLGLFRS